MYSQQCMRPMMISIATIDLFSLCKDKYRMNDNKFKCSKVDLITSLKLFMIYSL